MYKQQLSRSDFQGEIVAVMRQKVDIISDITFLFYNIIYSYFLV